PGVTQPEGTNESLRYKFTNEFFGGYQLYRLLEGADVPELRPWRFNLITNYKFREGWFDGFHVGGAYRWQDKVTVGYPVRNVGSADAPEYEFDVDNPIK